MSICVVPMVPASARPVLPVSAVLALLAVGPAQAGWDERFAPFYFDPADPGRLYLDGPIDNRSPLALGRAIDAAGEPRELVLSSLGGSVYAGLVMAREVDRLDLVTIIPASGACYSACAFLYFAGADRRAEGGLGVHQISSDSPDFDSGQVALSDIVEALTEYSVPNEVLVLMLRTSADDIYVLSRSELASYGLEGPRQGGTALALAAPDSGAGSEIAPEASSAPAASPEAAAIDLLARYQRDWSAPNAQALEAVRAFYAEEVAFYGESRSLNAVMADKAAFAERWPERRYALDRSTATARCATPMLCTVEGEVTWSALRFDGAKRSIGRAFVALDLRQIGGLWRITSEDSHVIDRN